MLEAFSCTHVKPGVSAAQVFNLGFTTHTGTVAAADEWGDPVQRHAVNPSIPGSIATTSFSSFSRGMGHFAGPLFGLLFWH